MENVMSISPIVLSSINDSISEPFIVKIGGTSYEVSTHFILENKQSVLKQFMTLLLNNEQ